MDGILSGSGTGSIFGWSKDCVDHIGNVTDGTMKRRKMEIFGRPQETGKVAGCQEYSGDVRE
jgi:hypothetical protein